MCAERRIYTYITPNGTKSDAQGQTKSSYFLYCDPLPPNSDSPALEAAKQLKEEVGQAVETVLKETPDAQLDRPHLIAALEHAGRCALASIERGGPLVAGSALLICETIPKPPHHTETLIAGAGECRVYGIRDEAVEPIFCDPFHEDTPPGLSIRERHTVSTNLLGLETDLDVHVRRLRKGTYHTLVIANYPAYSFLTEGQRWQSLRLASESVVSHARKLLSHPSAPQNAELWVISKQSVPMTILRPSGDAAPPIGRRTKPRVPTRAAALTAGVLALMLIVGGSALYLTRKAPDAWQGAASADAYGSLTASTAEPVEQIDQALAMADHPTKLSPLPIAHEETRDLWQEEEIKQLHAELGEQARLLARIRANEAALAESLEARDLYVSALELELEQLQEETEDARLSLKEARAADPLVESERSDDQIASLQYVADDYDRLRQQYAELTSLVAEDARRTEELQALLDAEEEKVEAILCEAAEQQEEILSLHEMLAEAESRVTERDHLLAAKEAESSIPIAFGEDQPLGAAGKRALAALRARTQLLEKEHGELLREHKELAEERGKLQRALKEQTELTRSAGDVLSSERQKLQEALGELSAAKQRQSAVEEKLAESSSHQDAAYQQHKTELARARELTYQLQLSEDERFQQQSQLAQLEGQLRRERQKRQQQEAMLHHLSENLQRWKSAFQQSERSREELSQELAAAQGYPKAARSKRSEVAQTAQPSMRIHLVSPGDTLGSIAQRYYQTPDAAEKIYQANRDKIPNPQTLRVGTALVVP